MLSKLATLILGILAERERNPYEITKMLSELQTKKWLPMADSTVYATINNLKKKGMILGRTEKDGNLPEKTIYSITDEGEKELQLSITSFLEEDSSTSSGFDIGILLMHNLSKHEIQIKLKKKLERLEAAFYVIRKQILGFEMDTQKIAFTALSMLKHRQHLVEAEIKTVKELIRDLNVRANISDLSPFDMRMM
ncbi:MAG: putative transcriptional regulator [Stygiobacter sp.]|nr:MAG: putative transcriptional regulator [Stygiobacter sp.]KAF0158772.1 MAG: putative transcriptional regulator [Ignavibacteria bacterium]KAF0218269.1 MAG: putative transcriptional [Ignavibacteria bacterium]